jgi:hypothetical protein
MGIHVGVDDAKTALGPSAGASAVAVCDICERLIAEPGLAMYAWDSSETNVPGRWADFVVVHKGECRDAAEAKIGSEHYADMAFYHLLASLVANTGADPKVIAELRLRMEGDWEALG